MDIICGYMEESPKFRHIALSPHPISIFKSDFLMIFVPLLCWTNIVYLVSFVTCFSYWPVNY